MNTHTHTHADGDNAPTSSKIAPGGGRTRRAALGGLNLNATASAPIANSSPAFDDPEVCSHPTPLRQHDTVDLPQPPYTRKFSLASSRALALSQHLAPLTEELDREVATPLAPPSPLKPLESVKRTLDGEIFPYDVALLNSSSSGGGGGGGGGGEVGVGEEDGATAFLMSLDLGPFAE